MEPAESREQNPLDTLPFARSYQLEALEKAIEKNTIVFLETGSGKTLIVIMLLRNYANQLRKPSDYIAVFLVPHVVLVKQQAEAVRAHTDLNVGMYWGDMGVAYWDAASWRQEMDKHEVLVMTPQILLDGLRHSFFKLHMIKVMILDECHHASGKHPYACIMTEFYHRHLYSGSSSLPRIFGMTASPIKSKGCTSEVSYWHKIKELEDMMHSKVYTCSSESVLANYISFSNPTFKTYQHIDIPSAVYPNLVDRLKCLRAEHEGLIEKLDLSKSAAESLHKKMSKVFSNLMFCLDELGVWLALKAAKFFSCFESDVLCWGGELDLNGEKILKRFSNGASLEFATCIHDVDPGWGIGDNFKADVSAGLLTKKVVCLVESLLEYRYLRDIRCIIFVERVVTSVVLQSLLSEFLPKLTSWTTKYIAGNNLGAQSQTRKVQNDIVEEFRKGMVNVIVATSILEEGLDVQSCNLVIRFDPSTTVSSFIQSRGRARMKNSDYLLMVKSGDLRTRLRLENYLASGEIMRKQSLCHATVPCSTLKNDLDHEQYCVESTGAIANLSSSISLIYFYCSRLPSDGYFKPAPRCVIDKEARVCTLYLPKSCPILQIQVHGDLRMIKQKACLEACKQLHACGALTDFLVPDIVFEEVTVEEIGNYPSEYETPIYFPPELISQDQLKPKTKYFCYMIELTQNFDYDIAPDNVVLATRSKLNSDILSLSFDLEVDRGSLTVRLKYIGEICLSSEMVYLCRQFQITLFRVLMDHGLDKLEEILSSLLTQNLSHADYLLLPSLGSHQEIDWTPIFSVLFLGANASKDHSTCPLICNSQPVRTKSGLVCKCMLKNSLVYTPHNGKLYCITGFLEHLNGYSILKLRDGGAKTYNKYYESRHRIKLVYNQGVLLCGRDLFPLHNCLHNHGCRQQEKETRKSHIETRNAFVELPPELCSVIMSPIAISSFYSFTFLPTIMHRIESLLNAINLRKMHLDKCMQNLAVPIMKVLEAITTKKCQEKFHLKSLATLGDSFLKYAASQQLFKVNQSHHEGLLSIKKDKIVSNATLFKLGCGQKIQGFIRDEPFDPKTWIIPGDISGTHKLDMESLSEAGRVYVRGRRKLKSKRIADVVEALIGAYLSTGGEIAALIFMDWIGIKVDFKYIPYKRDVEVKADRHINVQFLQSLLKYSFNDPSLLVEALTHGSYMLPEIPRCYQRLEFLGDAVLDYLITTHLYDSYPGLSPGLLTDMRSASVNNDCYARSAVKNGLHKYILHASQELHKHIVVTVQNLNEVSLESTFGWECETSFPKVLGDVIESLAGAILVDSGYKKEVVFRSIRPLLEPLITPETLPFHPIRELNEICQTHHFELRTPIVSNSNGKASITVEVDVNGRIFNRTTTATDKKTAKKLACKEVLKALKANVL